MHFTSFNLLIILSIFIISNISTAIDCEAASQIAYTITVDKAGHGNFTTVQKAIDSIPSGNNRWVRVHVSPGVYMEVVNIGMDKPCILLEGSGSTQTIIAWDGNANTEISATFSVSAENFVAKNIAFQNTYNRALESVEQNEWKPAVAARICGDKAAFHGCGFIGFQDTLWDVEGRHHFTSCYVEGAVDFIWGGAQSVYLDTVINVTSARLAPRASAGYITAQGRQSESDPSGFLFLRGKIFGNGQVYLGRAYGPFSTVVFQGTQFDVGVVPQGWDAWNYVGQEKNFLYGEVGCTGAGSDVSKRVLWERNRNNPELHKFLTTFPIYHSRWIANQP